MSLIEEKHKDKIEQIKGTGILNGIVFKSFSSAVGNLMEKLPLNLIQDKAFFIKKLTATAVSSDLYKNYNILTYINDSSVSNHLVISPSLIIEEKEVDYFFKSLDECLSKGINLKTIELVINSVKSIVN